MAGVQVEVRIVFNNLPAVPGKANRAIGRRVHAAGFRVQADAQSRAPVDTGFLRSSILNQPAGDLATRVTVGAEYGLYVEMGTRRMAARPYLLPALNAEPPRLTASFAGFEAEIA